MINPTTDDAMIHVSARDPVSRSGKFKGSDPDFCHLVVPGSHTFNMNFLLVPWKA